jgi:hypothetical protein
MEKGDKVYLLYVSDQFDMSRGFSGWIDEYTIINPDVGEGLTLMRGPYGSVVARTTDDIYTVKLEAQQAMLAALKRRVDVVIKQMEKMTEEAKTEPVTV